MEKIKAFVGHSFNEEDVEVVSKFLKFFDRLKEMQIPFEWESAEKAEPEELSKKILQKMEGKNTFIGICTKKERVLINAIHKKSFFNPKFFLVTDDDFKFKATDWIIQEIGFAFGRGMEMILLIEKGLRNPSSLHGDLEYIEFERAFPEKSFIKITEMITDLLPKKMVESTNISEASKEPKTSNRVENKELSPKDTDIEIQTTWTAKNFDSALLLSVVRKDKEKEKEIVNKYIEMLGTEDKSAEHLIKVKALYYNSWINKENNFNKIKEISEQDSNNAQIDFYLGKLFSNCKEYDKAQEYFIKAANKTKINKDKMFYISDAIINIIESGNKNYNKLWDELIKLNSEESNNTALYTILAEIGKKNKNDFIFSIGSEALLNGNPYNEQTRFDLAYRYSEIEQDELTYFHYNILTGQTRSELYWNNFGVAAKSLNLLAKSISAYTRSAELEGTLAMSNIAYQYIKLGFLDDAENICNKALKIKDFDKNVAGAISSIKSQLDYEKEEEKNILEKAKLHRTLLLKFADAYIKSNFILKSKLWKHAKCNLTVQITDNNFKAKGIFEEKETDFSSIFNTLMKYDPKSLGTPTEIITTNVIFIEGRISGHIIEAYYYEYKEKDPKEEIKKSEKEIIMLVDDQMVKIEAYHRNQLNKFFDMTIDIIDTPSLVLKE